MRAPTLSMSRSPPHGHAAQVERAAAAAAQAAALLPQRPYPVEAGVQEGGVAPGAQLCNQAGQAEGVGEVSGAAGRGARTALKQNAALQDAARHCASSHAQPGLPPASAQSRPSPTPSPVATTAFLSSSVSDTWMGCPLRKAPPPLTVAWQGGRTGGRLVLNHNHGRGRRGVPLLPPAGAAACAKPWLINAAHPSAVQGSDLPPQHSTQAAHSTARRSMAGP